MIDTAIVDFATAGFVLVAGLLCALFDRRSFEWRWLLAAVGLVLVYNFLLSRGYGLVPRIPGGSWNWTGMALAFVGTLALAALPGLGWRRAGLKLAQRPGSLKIAVPVALIYCLCPIAIALIFGGSEANPEAIAFQGTLPGMAEEVFYRGVLLLALDQAFHGRLRLLGVQWGFGAVLSCALFGLVHALSYDAGSFGVDPLTFVLTGAPSFVAVWLRYRTGSVLLPIVVHNFGNSIQMAF